MLAHAALLLLLLIALPAQAVDPPAVEPHTAVVFNRPIITFRSNFLGSGPVGRADALEYRVRYLLARGGPGKVDTETLPQGIAVRIDGSLAYVVTPGDANAAAGETLEQTVAASTAALTRAIDETRESRNLNSLLASALRAAAASLVALAALWLLVRLRHRVAIRMVQWTGRHVERVRVGDAPMLRAERVSGWVRQVLSAAYWVAVLLVAYEWLGYVLSQFPYTRRWGEQLTLFLFDTLVGVAEAIAHALPNLVTAVVIFIIARWIARSLGAFFDRVETGQVHVDWLDAELARPTRRIVSVVVWIFALVMAYPYLPGAQTDAFKGISVLVGLMISLGGASVIGQAFSGLILMYTRTLHVGEYVRIADHEGTIVEITLYMTRLRTGMGEELSIPNSLVLSSVVRNYSRAVRGKGFLVDTTITIGYDAPWRQVEAMLLEAAQRTPGVLAEPRPEVFQTSLSDFYPAYRLSCQALSDQPRSRAQVLSRLHQNIQDVFNEHGVQIMSPHYVGDPQTPKVVPPAQWRPPPAVAEEQAAAPR